jgi:CMP-N-acetylneuraminic acid synthetase
MLSLISNVIYNNSLMYGGSKTGYVLIPKNRSFEIDNYEDITLIEAIIKYNVNE